MILSVPSPGCCEHQAVAGRPRLASVVVAEYSEVYSLEREDLFMALAGWPRLQAIVEEVVAACGDIEGAGVMPPFEQLAAEVAAGRQLPPHPSHVRFTAIMHRICAEYDAAAAAGGESLPQQAHHVTLLEALDSQVPPWAPGGHAEEAPGSRPGFVPANGTALLVDCTESLCSPLGISGGRGPSIDMGRHAAALPSVARQRSSMVVSVDGRSSADIRRPGGALRVPSQHRSSVVTSLGSATPPSHPAAWSSVLNGGSPPTAGGGGRESLQMGRGHGSGQGDSGPSAMPLPQAVSQPGPSAQAADIHRAQPGGLHRGALTMPPTWPPVTQQAAGHSNLVSPRDVLCGASRDREATAVIFAVDAEASHVDVVGSSVAARQHGHPVGMACSPSQAFESAQGAGEQQEDGDSSVRNALQPRSMAQMRSGSLALSRRVLIGERKEHTSLAQQALQQVRPHCISNCSTPSGPCAGLTTRHACRTETRHADELCQRSKIFLVAVWPSCKWGAVCVLMGRGGCDRVYVRARTPGMARTCVAVMT